MSQIIVNGKMSLRSSTKATLAKIQENPAPLQPQLRLVRCDSPAATVEVTPEVPTPAPRARSPAPRRLDSNISRLGCLLGELDSLFAEASSLADSREWTDDDVEAVQAIRLSSQDQQKLYKSSSQLSLMTSFFREFLEEHKSDNAASSQPGNAASPKKKRNRRKKRSKAARAAPAAPAAPPVRAAPAASEKTQKRKDERSGNGVNRHRTATRRPAAALDVNHRDLFKNKKLLSRTRKWRHDYCLRFSVPYHGHTCNEDRLESLIACRPADYHPPRYFNSSRSLSELPSAVART